MSDQVYKGFWTNWEDGRVKGATLTIPTYQGLILVSFLTLYVQFSGACFWMVVCFVLHQVRSTTAPRDGLFHQQQAILRNSITAPNAIWRLARSTFAWRGKVGRPLSSSLPLMLITVVHIAFFAAAGLFSSYVTDTTTGVALVKATEFCGLPPELANPRNTDSLSLSDENLRIFNAEVILGRLTITKSAAYVRTCYNDDTNSATATCNVYVQPHLVGTDGSSISNGTVACPFGSNACAVPPVRYDSGHIRSDEDLGINNKKQESMSMRRVTTCAPILADAKYSTTWKDGVVETHVGKSTTSAKYYEFGNGTNACEGTSDRTDNTTFCVTRYEQANFQSAYSVRYSSVYDGNEDASDFKPIPDFQVPHADVTLASILSTAKYAGNVTDPLFSALTPYNETSSSHTFFTSTNDLNVLGCAEQYQFCNLGNGRCTELSGLYAAKQAIDNGSLALTPRQNATYYLMWKSAWAMSLQWSFEVLGDNVLLAREWVFTVKSQTSSSLPPNQWELESYNLHNLSLAIFQRRVNEYAKPENIEISNGQNSLKQIQRQTDPEMQALCGLQKIRSSDHYSFSVLGMSVILIVGSLFILLDWVMIQQIFWFRSVTHVRLAKKADWTNTGVIRLHQQTLESRGVGPWSLNDYEFPTLIRRQQTFTGLGTQPDPATPLTNMPKGDWNHGQGQATWYDGGKYSALQNQTSALDDESHALRQDKGHDRQ